jgi:uncharacterized SAM-binding protein YcdF (DUF218 family)
VLVALGLVSIASAPVWLPFAGAVLEKSGPPHKADIAVVLAGDVWGDRVLEGAELARAGYVPKVLVSGPSLYDTYECDLAIQFAVKHGYPESIFVRSLNPTTSTRAEAAAIVPVLRRMGVRSFILVTSDYHTRRAGRLFHAAAPDLEMYVVAAPDAQFRLGQWWKDREGRKTVLLEWSKTVATLFGM